MFSVGADSLFCYLVLGLKDHIQKYLRGAQKFYNISIMTPCVIISFVPIIDRIDTNYYGELYKERQEKSGTLIARNFEFFRLLTPAFRREPYRSHSI